MASPSTIAAATHTTIISTSNIHGGKDETQHDQEQQELNEKKGTDERKNQRRKEGTQTVSTLVAGRKGDRRCGLPIHSFNHLSKETENVEAMIKFYTKVMGFRRIKRPPFPFAGAWLFMPPTTSLHIIEKDPSVDLPEGPCAAIKKMGNWQEVAKNPASLKRVGHHMAFRTEDLELTIELLKEFGIGFAENVVPLTGQRQLFFFDPDGNGIEICECDVDPPPFLEDELEEGDEDGIAFTNEGGLERNEASNVQDK